MPDKPERQNRERPTGEGRNSFDSTDLPLRAEDAQPDERTLEGSPEAERSAAEREKGRGEE